MHRILPYSKGMDFGHYFTSAKRKAFYNRFNNEVLNLCRSIPQSMQTDTLIFLMRYAGADFEEQPNFFRRYHSPIWSILYRLEHLDASSSKHLISSDVQNAVTAQSMAMLLHSVDDHLLDGQISLSSTTLLLRSQAWTILHGAFRELTQGLPTDQVIIDRFLNEYYLGIRVTLSSETLENYCNNFVREMALTSLVPYLLAIRMKREADFADNVLQAFESFGIAWRLLDDIQDIDEDLKKGARSSIYCCFPEKLQILWEKGWQEDDSGDLHRISEIADYVIEHGILRMLTEKICFELQKASLYASKCNMPGLACEFEALVSPLRSATGAC